MTVMVDRHGHRVEAISLSGVPVFKVTDAQGYKVPSGYGAPDPKTPTELAALGVDLASLEEVAAAA